MSSAHNPYAPPKADVDTEPGAGAGLYRDGEMVRMGAGARLPDRCIRCNEPAEGYRAERTFFRRPAWWRALMWIGLPLLFILGGVDPMAMIAFWLAVIGFGVADIFVRTKVAVAYGLCARHRRLRTGIRAGFVASWVLLIGFAAAGARGFHAVEHWWFWAIALAMFAFAIAASMIYRFKLARLTGEHMWLQGTGRRFYESLRATNE